MSGTDAESFSINPVNDIVTLKASADFEAKNSYAVNIVATDNDSGNLSGSKAVVIRVIDVNEAPVITSGANADIAENIPASTVVYTATATDVDTGQTLSYSLSGTDAASFVINALNGEVAFKNSPNFEAKNSYAINVVSTDNGAEKLNASKAVTINVTDVNEAPPSNNVELTTLEDTHYTFASGDFSFTDQDAGDVLQGIRINQLPSAGSLTLNGVAVTLNQDISLADINAGALQFMPAANAYGDHYSQFSASVSDGIELSGSNTVTLNVTPVRDDLLLIGTPKNDRLVGDLIDSGSFDTLKGLGEDDLLIGKDGDDLLVGNLGHDRLRGGNGNDVLKGDSGKDTQNGGLGADRFIYSSRNDTGPVFLSRDRITDFSSTQGDKIDVTALDADSLQTGVQGWTFVDQFTGEGGQITFVETRQLLRFDLDGDAIADMNIRLIGVDSFTSADLIL